MAKRSGTPTRAVGLALLVLGIGLAVWGFQMSGSLGSELNQALTGTESDRVMQLYIGGAVSFLVGLYLTARG
ncbi:DUF3185 family protein [Thiohalospira sp.]|uniref:DUF3185 family protein n=1 Tax=Thiohalospira sp. TaxID=3080549 RepID=UPI0039814DEC